MNFTDATAMPESDLIDALTHANNAYRNTAEPIMSDAEYDALIAELTERNPDHPYLNAVEPETDFGIGKIRHSRPMLSTEKPVTMKN